MKNLLKLEELFLFGLALFLFAKNSIQASFATVELKTKYLREIDQWEKSYLTELPQLRNRL
ncbi:MAG: hypothetical protein QY306_12500 [Anaerolineales bacterium]|nr:MAG: hypothetical protein QY306_12500 [Anaerolineales bacterium]